MGNFVQVTPWMQARDVDGMVRFFVEVLGFRAWVQAWDYAYVERDGVGVRIGKASEGAEERHEMGVRAFLFYVDVRDVAAVVEEVRPRLLAAGMAGGDGPVDQSWGQREWWVPVPEGGLIVFGEEIVRGPVISGPEVAVSRPRTMRARAGTITRKHQRDYLQFVASTVDGLA